MGPPWSDYELFNFETSKSSLEWLCDRTPEYEQYRDLRNASAPVKLAKRCHVETLAAMGNHAQTVVFVLLAGQFPSVYSVKLLICP